MIFIEWLFITICPIETEMAKPWQLGSQDTATPMMQGIMDLHHDIFFFLILILVCALWHFHYKKNPIPQRIVHGTTIEILRTIFLCLFLLSLKIKLREDNSKEGEVNGWFEEGRDALATCFVRKLSD